VLFAPQENPFCQSKQAFVGYVTREKKRGNGNTYDNALKTLDASAKEKEIELKLKAFNICIKTFLLYPLKLHQTLNSALFIEKQHEKWLKKSIMFHCFSFPFSVFKSTETS
jgi:hypothetical protein